MAEAETEEPPEVDEDFELHVAFDVQRWAEAYLTDTEAQAEHALHPGVPFH
jgi:hypothetical protein